MKGIFLFESLFILMLISLFKIIMILRINRVRIEYTLFGKYELNAFLTYGEGANIVVIMQFVKMKSFSSISFCFCILEINK